MAQQTPYIGSKISLISKSEIRYEGILYTVDTIESTIALAKVRSFGTEDRPTETPVAGRDEIYEYIIFKASDIKDLMVCETPKPVPQLQGGLPYDPAILSVSSQHAPGQATSPAGKGISGSSSRSGTPLHRQNNQSPTNDTGVQTSRAPGAGRQQRGSGQGGPPNARGGGRGGFQQQYRGGGQNGVQMQGQVPQGPPSYRNALMGGPGGPPRGGPRGGPMGGPYPGNFPPRGGFIGQRGAGGARGAPRGGNQQGRGGVRRDGEKDKLKFDSDYDFEKANEQFKETLNTLKDKLKHKVHIGDEEEGADEKKDDSGTETGVEVSEVHTDKKQEGHEEDEEGCDDEDAESFYDKTSSFFDRISCEALERQEGKNTRPNWRKERETNQETFGHSAVRSLAYRRGGGRGYGPRGGFQRGGYYGGRGGGGDNGGGYRGGENGGGGGYRGGYNNYYGGRGGGGGGGGNGGGFNNNQRYYQRY